MGSGTTIRTTGCRGLGLDVATGIQRLIGSHHVGSLLIWPGLPPGCRKRASPHGVRRKRVGGLTGRTRAATVRAVSWPGRSVPRAAWAPRINPKTNPSADAPTPDRLAWSMASRTVDPKASRMPISRVRCPTVSATSAKMPSALSSRASEAITVRRATCTRCVASAVAPRSVIEWKPENGRFGRVERDGAIGQRTLVWQAQSNRRVHDARNRPHRGEAFIEQPSEGGRIVIARVIEGRLGPDHARGAEPWRQGLQVNERADEQSRGRQQGCIPKSPEGSGPGGGPLSDPASRSSAALVPGGRPHQTRGEYAAGFRAFLDREVDSRPDDAFRMRQG
jgi:hypothetical protein